jgi:hypothetical protein
VLQAQGINPNGEYWAAWNISTCQWQKQFGKKTTHVMKYYYIWKEGGSMEVMKKRWEDVNFSCSATPLIALANFAAISDQYSHAIRWINNVMNIGMLYDVLQGCFEKWSHHVKWIWHVNYSNWFTSLPTAWAWEPFTLVHYCCQCVTHSFCARMSLWIYGDDYYGVWGTAWPCWDLGPTWR